MFGAIAGGLGGLIGAGLDFWGQERANQANVNLAREQMAFQERMANSSWQRGVEDMRKAGINPILAAGHGGASSPSGAMPHVENSVSGATAKGLESFRTKADVDLKRSEIDNKIAENQNLHDMNSQIKATTAKTAADTNLTNLAAQKMEIEKQLLASELPGALTEAKIDSGKYGEIVRYINRINPLANTGAGYVSKIKLIGGKNDKG